MNAEDEVYQQVCDLYEKNFRKYISRVSPRVGGRGNAEDVVQEAFCRALNYCDTLTEGEPIEPWFNTILNNSTRDFKKQEVFEGMATEDEEESTTLEDLELREDVVTMVLQEISDTREPKRTVFTGYFILGRTPGEIAKYSPMSKQEISSACLRFKKKLQRLANADGDR